MIKTHTHSKYCGCFPLFGEIVKLTLNETIYCFHNASFFRPFFRDYCKTRGETKMPSAVFVQNSDKAAGCNRHALANQSDCSCKTEITEKKLSQLVKQ